MRSFVLKGTTALLVAGAVFSSANGAALALQDVPLYLLSRADPNVLLNMSVETPMGGAAYTDQVGVPTGCAGRSSVSGQTVGTCYLSGLPVHRLLQPGHVLRVLLEPVQYERRRGRRPHMLGCVER
jgi:hypothetical protein